MHKLCIEYAYAYLGISIHDYPYVHIGTGNSCPDMDEHWLLHDRFMLGMYKDEYLGKKSNSEYDDIHIWVSSKFISNFFDISKQHWFKLQVSVMSIIPCGPILCPQSKL